MLNYFCRSAFETWKHAIKENRVERQNENVAEAFQNQMLLSRVSETENYITGSVDKLTCIPDLSCKALKHGGG